MKVADMHCDTFFLLGRQRKAGEEAALWKNGLHMDLMKMRQGEYLLQNFALFLWQQETEDLYEECLAGCRLFAEEMEANRELISQVRTFSEIEENQRQGKISALLTVEEGEVCQGEQKKLEQLYDLGVRMMTLVWNYDNSLTTSAAGLQPPKPRRYQGDRPGLTETGVEFVERMEEMGMIPDVSHMSDDGIRDMLKIAKRPFVASHSNVRALCAHKRNLTDEFLKAMGERGCVIGANFYSGFLDIDAELSKTARIADHILYMVDRAGIENVGLGSDFDGIECGLEMKNCGGIQSLAEELRKRGMSAAQIERIFYKNVLRLYKEWL